ncbi:PEP-CTERM sorting domain-containing protein [Candidatus Thiodictyon syntrophicum]|jgi:hypothetical protein|uniref:PEP-CTERM protein-sorting domain-containing protein n=1 Tax=Candidatus Thiodictyon syntrophicum TaxID=1166950 RepID=A0A2K8UAJ1_9GAMM|nr:PEP-CTERM sorting domain-containing protein [Candidatus Thiodictyon syntrophicum]AUB82439.1 hypothetical protein THSYN_16810 [Candidatus Thiodictyon syntrophicum]
MSAATQSNPFDRLRLALPAAGLAATVAVGAAQAANVNLPLTLTVGQVIYGHVNTAARPNDYSGLNNSFMSMVVTVGGATGTGGTEAFRIGEAALKTAGSTMTDAFDSFAGIRVNGTFFQQPGTQVDLTTTGAGAFVNTTQVAIGDIGTRLDYFMDGASPTLRVLASFTNTGNSDQTVEVLYGGALGSDDDTQIEDTSSGDADFQQADRWLISSDGGDGPDPVLTLVRYGEGTVQAASDTLAVPGTDSGNDSVDYFTDVWSLDLGVGETQSLMWFVQFSPDVATAQGGTGVFDDLEDLDGAGLLAAVGGGKIDTANIVNWAPTEVPVPGVLPLLGIGLFGMGVYRRRRV